MVMYTLEQPCEVGLRSTFRRCRFWQKKIIFSDEVHFDFGGYVNEQNCRIWGTETQFLFENEQGEAVIVNGDRYRAMLNEFLFTKIEKEDIRNIWFQQDGATCHTAEATRDVCVLFLKIALSAVSFNHLGAAI